MRNSFSSIRVVVIATSISLVGCATSPYHETLMTNQQLLTASCSELAVEHRKVEENAIHTAQAASSGKGGAVFLALLEATASHKSGVPMNNSGSTEIENLSVEHQKQAAEFESRKQLIALLQRKKSCA